MTNIINDPNIAYFVLANLSSNCLLKKTIVIIYILIYLLSSHFILSCSCSSSSLSLLSIAQAHYFSAYYASNIISLQ